MVKRRSRSGFVALVGRPNVGKSSLLNRLTGEKLAIVSPKPQTTRNRILGVVTKPQGQVAFLDTPGIHAARGPLNQRMVDIALRAIREVDVAMLVCDASAAHAGREKDKEIIGHLREARVPTLLAVNKIDLVAKPSLLPVLDAYRREYDFAALVPVSAREGDGIDALLETTFTQLPEGEPLFDPDMLTDQAERALVAEFVREQVLRHCRQEIPYSTAVVVDRFDESEREPRQTKATTSGLAGLVRVDATIFVERESQKAIVIGKRGQLLKAIGTDARKAIERLLGTHLYLSLRVQVEPDWTVRPDKLRRLGYE